MHLGMLNLILTETDKTHNKIISRDDYDNSKIEDLKKPQIVL